MANARDGLVAMLQRQREDTSLRELLAMVNALSEADVMSARPPTPRLYTGWKRMLITSLGIGSIGLAILSVFIVQKSRAAAVTTYAFWAIAPPAWFFIEWVWLFDSAGDAHRLAQFHTTTELAQKFWAGVLVLLAVVILITHGLKL
jgi:hypothetical protein